MKIRLASILAVVLAGILAVIVVVSGYITVEKQYNANLEKARANVEKQIPYNAYHAYQQAFKLRCEDEEVFKEYLAQAKLLGEDFYTKAIKEYVERFPTSVNAHELYCGMQYDNGSYRNVITAAMEARENGAASEQVKAWYLECVHMLTNVKSDLEDAQSFLGSYARVKVNGAYGYLSQNGKFLLAPLYEQASPMLNGNAAVWEKGEWHMINDGGFVVARTDVPVDSMSILVGGKIAVSQNGKYGYTNTSMLIPETRPYDYASNFKNGVAAVKKGDKWALINSAEEMITDYIFDEILLDEFDTCHNAGVIFVKKDGKYYMVNASGAKITDQAFDNAYPFASNEPAAVCIGDKWGFIATNGQFVIEPRFADARSFSIGLGGVCVDGKWGYINTSGDIRIACQFEDCKSFAGNGIAAVKEDGFWRYVQLLAYRM